MSMVLKVMAASWSVFQESALFMLFGFLMAAVLSAFVNPGQVAHYLGRGRIRPVFLSALFGIPIPLCSCGVVPAAAGLRRQGANKGATLSFLISTPESGVDSIPVTYALMDPVMTLIRPVAAFVTAIIAGLAENFIGNSDADPAASEPAMTCRESNCGCQPQETFNEIIPYRISFFTRLGSGLKFAFIDLLGDIGKWFILGVILAGLITCLLPDLFFEQVLGGNKFFNMLIMLVAGIPMYVCATSSTPIAAALILKGLNPGAALVFLLAGPATNIASLIMVSGFLGRKSLVIYLGSIAISSLALGLLTDLIYEGFGITARVTTGQAGELFPGQVEIAGAVVLIILLAAAIRKSYKNGGPCSCR